MRWLLLTALFLSATVQAQQFTSYEFRVYRIGDSFPISTFLFIAAYVTCNKIAPPIQRYPLTAINPTIIVWNDPVHAGRVCKWTGAGAIRALPTGEYEAALVGVDKSGALSNESNKVQFSARWEHP